jgi:hypothetical protein
MIYVIALIGNQAVKNLLIIIITELWCLLRRLIIVLFTVFICWWLLFNFIRSYYRLFIKGLSWNVGGIRLLFIYCWFFSIIFNIWVFRFLFWYVRNVRQGSYLVYGILFCLPLSLLAYLYFKIIELEVRWLTLIGI